MLPRRKHIAPSKKYVSPRPATVRPMGAGKILHTAPRGTARATGGRLYGAPYGTVRGLAPRPTVTIKPRPTVTIKPRPAMVHARPPGRETVLMGGIPITPKPPGQYPAGLPMVPAGPTPTVVLPTAAGTGLPAIGGNVLAGAGNIGTSISTGVGGILSVGRSYVPLAIKAVAIIIIIKLALWIFRRR